MRGKIKNFLNKLSRVKKPSFFDSIKRHDAHLEKFSTGEFLRMTKRMAHLTILSFWKNHKIASRITLVFLLFILLFSIFVYPFKYLFDREPMLVYGLDAKVEALLPEKTPVYNNVFSYDKNEQLFTFNKDYSFVDKLGHGGGAKVSAKVHRFPDKGVEIIDPINNLSLNITPKYNLEPGKRDDNRIVFDLPDKEGRKVLSFAAIGYKEDIILDYFQGDRFTYAYDIELPENTEMKLEQDGSIAVYGVRAELLGNVSTGTPEDEKLLAEARANADKDNLLFRLPAPYIKESGSNKESRASAYFEVKNKEILLHATNLRDATYPISIDPSVYVESARNFMRGNEETNVDFDPNNELIQKGSTTGARFNDWSTTMSLNDGRFDGGTVMAGGFAYYVGGVSGSATESSTSFSTPGTTTWNVPSGVSIITVELWGAGGGGGGGGDSGAGGAGGGGGYASATIPVTPLETLTIDVGGAGGAGDHISFSGEGGGGGGHSEVRRNTTPLVIAPGGGGGGGGDNSSSTPGGAGGAGGDDSNGIDGGNSSAGGGGNGATSSAGGNGGTGGSNSGENGASQAGGLGADGRNNESSFDGAAGGGGTNGGGNGGTADENAYGFAGGGGGGGGYYGGGGGSASASGDAGGGGGGGGTSYFDGSVSGPIATSGSGTTPGNDADADRAGAGQGGSGGSSNSSGTAGSNGIVVIKYYSSITNTVESDVMWANIDDFNGSINSPNPGAGSCAEWCSNSVYDLPDERKGFSLVAYNGFLYAIGGEDSTSTRQSTVYIAKIGANGEPQLWHPVDSDTDNWVYWYEDTSLPEALSYSGAITYNNRLYLVGGQTDSNPGGVTSVWFTDISPTGVLSGWTTTGVNTMSTARHMHSVEVYNDYLYVIGGDSSSSGALLNTVEYVKLAEDGTFSGSWESTSSFSGARRTNGGKYTTIYGAYIYLTGGCTSVSGGLCQTVGSEVQIASIFADGSLGDWSIDSGESNQRVAYGMHSWQGNVYRIGGCTVIITTSDGCVIALDSVDYGTINPPGEVSTVNITESAGNGNCVGGSPQDCDLPPLGDGAGQGGQMLSMSVILNGYLYNIGGCTNFGCSSSSGNVAYVQVGSDGTLQRESTCVANGNSYADSGNSAWCVDATNRVNGTNGIAAAGVTIFNNRIYLVGGIDETTSGTQRIYYNTVSTDGSLTGAWSSVTLAAAGIGGYSELSYTYSFARANPNSAGTNPGNLYIIGGCTSFSASAGCSNSYADEVYKCNITTTGSVSGCTTSGQLQIDVEAAGGNQGLGLHSGTVYANYIYLIGGYSDNVGDRDTVYYARINDSNNIVDADSGTAGGGDSWTQSVNDLDVGRRRGWAFGYNGHIYAVGGYDDTGTGIIPFIEWGKLNVSDGSLEEFVTSTITINQRWGLSMVVSNSFAYVIGGCDVGASPSACSSFEPSVQTFQLYNNDSGAQANFTESTGDFATNNDRIGSSSAIVDGYIYVAGGETSGTATTNVQVAQLNPNGTIGTWSDTTAALPAARAYGQLEVVGGDLYYIGGEDSGGDEKSEVYYASPTTGAATPDVIRTTTYKLASGEYAGTTYTLTLDNDLESDYFTIIAGGDNTTNRSGPDHSQVRVDGDPFGNLTATTNADELRLTRGDNTASWDGTITVVECVSSCSTDGFQLTDVLDVSLAANDMLEDVTLGSNHSSRTVPFGGFLGGGLSTSETNNFSATAGIRLRKNSTNQIRIERMDDGSVGTAGNAAAADVTIYVVEWGSNWNVQEVNIDNWNTGGQGVDATNEYATSAISSVTRANTWVWKSPGTSEDNGLGDGAFGKVITLGDGVNENATETTIAIGSEPSSSEDVRDDTVYVMEHSELAVDYEFVSRSNYGTSFTDTVASAIVSENVSTVGNVTSSAGYRLPLFYYTDNGTGTAYTRVAGWSHYHSNDTTISFAKGYSGNNQSGWIQSVDFGANAGSGGGGDITTWSTASNGLPADRTRHGAAVWNDRIYVVGGLNDSGNPTNTVYISPKLGSGGNITSAWASDSDVPDVARSGGALIAYANNLYFLGGNDGTNYLSDVQFTSIGYKTGTISQTGTTVTGSGTSWTASMVGSVIQYADGSFATITGYTSATSLSVDANKTVDPGTRYLIDDGSVGTWSFTTNLTQAVSDADGFAVNGFMYLFGGRRAASTCTNNSYVAPISANTTIDSGNNPTGIGEWYQTNIEFSGERYSSAIAYNEGKVYVSGGGCGTELTSNQHYYGTLRAQPQVARYSYYVDADTNVFPNSWLLNGLDNNIGARWQFGYRSAADAPNVFFSESFNGTDGTDVTTGNPTDFTSCYDIDASGSASATLDSTYFVSAGSSVEFSVNGGNSYAGCRDNTEDRSIRYDRFYIRPQDYSTISSPTPFYVLYNGVDVVGRLRFNSSTGQVQVQDRFTTDHTFSPLTINTWHRVEVGVENDQMSVRLFRDGNLHGEVPDNEVTIDLDDALAPDDFNEMRIGIASGVTFNYTFNIDDFESSNSGWVGTSLPDWGVETDFGDVILGRVESYTPLNGSSQDTSFARYMFLTISIDASQTFGYPDDVSRGPTISDMSVFFTADPNKRLRHGKTFIQGLIQPLDTPCRVSGAKPAGSQPNCPEP